MEIVKHFLEGLKMKMTQEQLEEWSYVTGATKEDIQLLKLKYPDCPQSFIHLLEKVDGTYYRKYGDKQVCLCILGSDVEEYPYYLLSIKEMLESSKEGEDVSYLLEEEEMVDPKINPEGLLPEKYIHFSDCMNNGGTSRLYLDFNPSEKGVYGQIVRYLHDPDEYMVIADSFDEYLQNLINDEFFYFDEDC